MHFIIVVLRWTGLAPWEFEFPFPGGLTSIDSLLVRIHFIIVVLRWTGLAPWEFELPFPGSLTFTFLETPTTSNKAAVLAESFESLPLQTLNIDR